MIRSVPMAEWEKALYQVLTAHITGYQIYSTSFPLNEGERPPEQYVYIGQYTCVPSSAKRDVADFRVTSNLHAVVLGNSRQILNSMFDDIVISASAGQELEEYQMPSYVLHDVDIGIVEAYEEESESGEVWQHGIVQLVASIQQKEI